MVSIILFIFLGIFFFFCQRSCMCPILICNLTGVPRLNTPPPLASTSMARNQERAISAPRPIRITPNFVNQLEDLSQSWTRSPTKSKMEPVLATWHFISTVPSSANASDLGLSCFPWNGCLYEAILSSIRWTSSSLLYVYCSLMKQLQIHLLSGTICSLLQCLIHMTLIEGCFLQFKLYRSDLKGLFCFSCFINELPFDSNK